MSTLQAGVAVVGAGPAGMAAALAAADLGAQVVLVDALVERAAFVARRRAVEHDGLLATVAGQYSPAGADRGDVIATPTVPSARGGSSRACA